MKYKEVHVIPRIDVIEHDESRDCPCNPVNEDQNIKDLASGDTKEVIWVHNRVKDQLN